MTMTHLSPFRRALLATTTLGLVCATATGAHANAEPEPLRLCDGDRDADVLVDLSAVPPSATTLYLTRVAPCDGDDTQVVQREVTWDPAFSPVLAHMVRLPLGRYRVAMSSESAFTPGGDGALRYDRAWSLGPATPEPARWRFQVGIADQPVQMADSKTVCLASGDCNARRLWRHEATLTVTVRHAARATPAAEAGDRLADLIALDRLPAIAPAAGPGARSFLDTAIPPGIAETLSLLTEVIVERAKSYASLKLKARFERLVCQDLPRQLTTASQTGKEASPAPPPPITLDNLCEAVQQLDVFNLAASGKTLLNALLADVGALARTNATAGGGARTVAIGAASAALAPVWLLLSTPAAEREAALLNLARTVVYGLIEQIRARAAAFANTHPAVGVVAAGVAYCAAQSRCDLPDLWRYLEGVIEQVPGLTRAGEALSSIVALATRGANLLADVSDSHPRARLRDAINWVLDVLELAAPDIGRDADFRRLRHAVAVVDALLEGDGRQVAIAAGAALVSLLPTGAEQAVERVARLVTSLAPLMAEAPVDATPEERAAFRAEKKQAIEQMIDGATSRRNRERRGVLSVYGGVGVYGGARIPLSKDAGSPSVAGPLSVSIGAGYSRLPTIGASGPNFHIGLTLLDLGQLLSFDDDGEVRSVRVGDVLAPGIQVGLLFGDPVMPVSLLLDGRVGFRPAASDPGNGGGMGVNFQVGLVLGLQVPLFDFN